MPYKKKPAPAAKNRAAKAAAINAPGEKTGFSSLLFSFDGRISRELHVGLLIQYTAASILLFLIERYVKFESIEASAVMASIVSMAHILVCLAIITMDFKRAHAMGYGGFISILGNAFFGPLFALSKFPGDETRDSAYLRGPFKKWVAILRRMGAACVKNGWTFLAFTAIAYPIAMIPYFAGLPETAVMLEIMFGIAVFEMLQIPFAGTKFFKRAAIAVIKLISYAAAAFLVYIYMYSFYKAHVRIATSRNAVQAVQMEPQAADEEL
ncbi:MAG: hypothetical protein LBO78_03305 [Rickettsiales bacterium]|nr:hypothetical protein [Rickettsiales bacterium]